MHFYDTFLQENSADKFAEGLKAMAAAAAAASQEEPQSKPSVQKN